ncbi:MAG TPA: class II glutamine amidotransferase [Vicinamibacteria bacterium]|nr:class II glutamine amidotransferase [Vicinamibacteria bacterium]
MAYSGAPVALEELLFKPKHSLIDQSMSSHSPETPTNGDGFGVGWYDARGRAGLFRSIRPAWNDFNLRETCAIVESPLFLAHVRATSQATVQETNCHPFRYGRWLFVHNGEIQEIEKLRRELLFRVDPRLFSNISGTTDSEVMFFLALTFGLESDPVGAVQAMAGFVEEVARKIGVSDPLWMTLGFSDGEKLYAVRYATDGDAPTLYHSRAMEDLYELNPALRDRFSADARAIVSEPPGEAASGWTEIPQSSVAIVERGEIVYRPFEPRYA